MPDQRDVQQLIQSLTPSAVNNGNPNTVYNQPMPQGGYIPPTFDPGTNTWRVNPAPAAPTVNWQQLAMSQPQSWNWAQPTPPPTPVPPNPGVPGPTTPVPTTPVPTPTTPTGPAGGASPEYGSGGGGDGVGGCVVVESFLSDYDRADEVQVGDIMSVVDPVKRTTSTGTVSYSVTKLMPCVRITTESGIVLECSTTAPIADERGEQVLAPDLLNKLIPVVDNGVHYLDRVASIEDIGEKEVRHITVENNFFLAGKEKGRYIYHHNIKFDGNGVDLFAMMDNLNSQFGWSTASNFMDSSSPNTRGAMQANGTWDTAHGGTASNPATAWGESRQNGGSTSNYTPTGQGLLDAFGGSTLPTGSTFTAPNPWAQPSILDSWNTAISWLTPSPIDFSGYGPQLNAPPQLQIGEQGSAGGGILNWLDNNLAGNLYDENSGTWNKGNILGGIASAVTGIPINEGVLRMGTSNLIQGGGFGSDYARTQLQQQYDRSNSQQRSEFIQRTAAQYNTTPEKLLEVIGR